MHSRVIIVARSFSIFSPQGGEIDFLTYLSAADKAQRNMYEHSEVGQAELAKMGLKADNLPVVFPT